MKINYCVLTTWKQQCSGQCSRTQFSTGVLKTCWKVSGFASPPSLKWEYNGVCSNFFIPQNNMFLANVHGQAQSNLFQRLYGLYEKGILLLQSPSIRFSIIDVVCNPSVYWFLKPILMWHYFVKCAWMMHQSQQIHTHLWINYTHNRTADRFAPDTVPSHYVTEMYYHLPQG